jgi:hypothetical protein
VNGIHEVSGSIPLGSINKINILGHQLPPHAHPGRTPVAQESVLGAVPTGASTFDGKLGLTPQPERKA